MKNEAIASNLIQILTNKLIDCGLSMSYKQYKDYYKSKAKNIINYLKINKKNNKKIKKENKTLKNFCFKFFENNSNYIRRALNPEYY